MIPVRKLIMVCIVTAGSLPAMAQVGRAGEVADVSDSVVSWRAAFRGAESKDGLRTFLGVMKEAVERGASDPTVNAFRATAEVMTAGRKWNPLAKLVGFRKWTGRLDRQVEAAPDNPDIRLLRLAVRAKAPSFLGYVDGIAGDCSTVLRAVESGFWEGDREQEEVALHVLNSVEACR